MDEYESALHFLQTSYPRSMDNLRMLHTATTPKMTTQVAVCPTATMSPCKARRRSSTDFEAGSRVDDGDKRFQANLSSRAFPEREDIKWQRHTFSALPSEMSELARRQMEDQTEPGSQSLPPMRSPTQSRLVSHVEHLRVYGRLSDTIGNPFQDIRQCEQAGEAFIEIEAPAPGSVWTRGKSATISWTGLDEEVTHVNIDLLEQGSLAKTEIAHKTANTGSFVYSKVPWGMAYGDKYFLLISSSADPSRYITTDFFSINSAP